MPSATMVRSPGPSTRSSPPPRRPSASWAPSASTCARSPTSCCAKGSRASRRASTRSPRDSRRRARRSDATWCPAADPPRDASWGGAGPPATRPAPDTPDPYPVPFPRTKIVCTLGPSTATRETLSSLMEAGLNVARLNFSHGTHDQHARTVELVRSTAQELGRPVAILGDLQGPRIRIGDLDVPREVQDGQDIVLVAGEDATGEEFPTTYEGLCKDVKVGDRILVDDGLIELVTMEVSGTRVHCRVLHGGKIKSHKGMNLPGVAVSAPSITEKDWADVTFAVEHGLEYVALSFVRRAADIAELRTKIPKEMLVVSKIEKDSALDNIESIIHASDAVMVARGDLGVELPFEEVPIAQKRIITLANRLGRPVITATQMLESMITNPRPTRAEASDVANAILDGTDAVMLSAETAAGQYPRLAVEAMTRIIAEIEGKPHQFRRDDPRRSET